MSWEFANPWFLVLLLLIPAMVCLRHIRQTRATLSFSDVSAFADLPKSWPQRLHPLLTVLFTLGWIMLITALARPREGLSESKVETEIVDMVLVVDTSTSMRALDMSHQGKQQDRLDAAKAVVTSFVDTRRQDRFGLVTFAGMPYTVTPMTMDHDRVLTDIDRLETGMVEDGTAIGSAIASAVNRLRGTDGATKLILLLTDGSENSNVVPPKQAAEMAEALGIKIYSVACGSKDLVPVPTQDFFGRSVIRQQHMPIDEETLKEISAITHGRFFRATNFEELKNVYEEIDELERTEIEVDAFTVYDEKFGLFALAGFLLILSERILGTTRIGRALS